ncbi:MAG TPA: LURP-one-related family protein [Caldilineaceae bacterium]|nr:LURP-one-related family protein [Caldilineaceae bacterium]
MFGNRREERREDRQTFGRGGNATRYQMRQRMISIGDDFWIENAAGAKVYKVDGKALRVRQTLIFEDAQGHELAKIQERMLRIKDTMEIEGPNGESLAVVKKALITPLRERFTAKIKNGPDMEVQGNILDHEYEIGVGRDKIAEVSKKWFRLRDSYGVEIEPGQDDFIILAVTVVIDEMVHQGR